MAFANLFTGLSAVEEGVKRPGQPSFTHRNETESGQKGNARKRKIQVEQTGPYKKKPCYEAQTTRSYNATSFREEDSKAIHYHMHNTDSKHASVGFTKEVIHNHGYKAGHNNKGQNYTTKNNPNVNYKQQKKKPQGQKNHHHHQQKDRRRPANKGGSHQTQPPWGKGGRHRHNNNDKQGVQVKHTRCMSQEFKDQNAVLVDGRLICRHFLWGRCIKEDECQLEHVKGHNNLVKEVCKFYVQGFCTKGESCPYMHKSFPCKFFHRKGKCSQGADCRFSHEPLDDITNQLLHETLKRDDDLCALSKKAEQEPSGQPENTDESEITEASRTSDILLQPLRPNFYNSGETNAEKETLLCQTEEPADVMEEAVPPHASDAAQPYIPPSSNLKHEEPVCYSVAAVLGPQLFRPFPNFFTTPESQESGSSLSANQSEVPYSVDAVLRSCKSVENSTFTYTPTPPTAQTVSYTPKTDFEVTVPMLSSETQDEKVLNSVNTRNEVNKVFKSLSSLQVHTSLLSKNCPSLTLASRDNEPRVGNMPKSIKPAQRATYEVKLELLHSPVTVAEKSVLSKGDMKGCMHVPLDITCSDTCKSKGVLPFARTNCKSIFSRPLSQTSTSKHPTQLRPHLSVMTSDSEPSKKPFSPPPCFTDFKSGAAVPVEPVTSSIKTSDLANSDSRHFVEKRPTEIHLHSKKTQFVLNHDTQQPYSTEITAECSSKTAHDLAVGCKKTLKRPFHNLFASPITDTLQPIDNSVPSSSCSQGFIQSSCPAPQPAGCRSNRVKSAVEPDKAPARSFHSLFAAPLSVAPLQCIQSQPDYSRTSSCPQQSNQPVDNTSHLSNSKPSIPLQHQVRTVKEIYCATRSSYFSPNPKIENIDGSTEHIKKPTKQLLNPVCSLDSLSETFTGPTPCGNSPSTTHAHQQLPDIASDKADTANSVLKTLFLCLSPYEKDEEQQDSIQISVPSDSRLQVQQSTEKTAAHSTEHQPFLQTPQIPLEATGGSTLSSPGRTELQVRNSGTHYMPFKPVTLLMQHHTRPRQKHASEEVPWVKGEVVVKPLKDLFKTLESTVFHFGH